VAATVVPAMPVATTVTQAVAPTPAPVPAAPTAAADILLATPVQELSLPTPSGALITDANLDIDEDEEEDYYEEEEDRRGGKLSGPLFILILFFILVLQVLFVGYLFSQGILDIGAFGVTAFDIAGIY
jgi:hypothetical protein